MSNYHLEVDVVSRGKGQSITRLANYISGKRLHDAYLDKTFRGKRNDVLFQHIFLPDNAPQRFSDLQTLCDEVEKAEIRWDARTARQFKGSLPNELPHHELIRIVQDFVDENFTAHNLCAIVAIHEGLNNTEPAKNNPHAHIIVPTRCVDSDGFSRKKDREHDHRKYISIWREQWAKVQNLAYERNGLDIRVSHESLEVQGIRDREPTLHLSRSDWAKEKVEFALLPEIRNAL